MLTFIDDALNKVTMYRLVLYGLVFLWIVALCFGIVGLLPYSPLWMIVEMCALGLAGWIANGAFARVFEAPSNAESVLITILILALLIAPAAPSLLYYGFLMWAAVLAMASKYVGSIGKKHVFNPAALAVAITAFALGRPATWWIGTAVLLPFVLAVGLLFVRKIHRFDLALSFIVAAVLSVGGYALVRGTNAWLALQSLFVNSPLVFLGTVMLTEPITTPPTRARRMWYGALVGAIFSPVVHIGAIYSTPELALLVGNIFSYAVSPKQKLILALKRKVALAPDAYDFAFAADQPFTFSPGQYMEWTLGHAGQDSRGIRRYFTLASSPTEPDIRLGVKFYPNSSSFKRTLARLKEGDTIVASQLAGDFTLPPNPDEKLAFIAGGIGITPFRSMAKYLLDRGEERSVILLYSNKTKRDILYRDVFDEAESKIGWRTVYTLTDGAPADWTGRAGPVTPAVIREEVPDWKERTFYLSGPRSMVASFESALRRMGVSRRKVKTDYFPGFA